MNRVRKGQMRGVEQGASWVRSRSSPACLEWPPKLSKKGGFTLIVLPREFVQHSRKAVRKDREGHGPRAKEDREEGERKHEGLREGARVGVRRVQVALKERSSV